jgi:hypothetical protein
MPTTPAEPWSPPRDDDLTWFREKNHFPAPRPLEYTLEVHALVFGLTYALESLEFPLYEFRSRLHNGRLYLAAVPSAMAERDLQHRMQGIRDQSLRFTRNVSGAWERQIKPEIERYNRWIEETGNFGGFSTELAERFRQLRRVRGNQWYAMIRGVIAPTAMLQRRMVPSSPEASLHAENAVSDGLTMVAQRGGALMHIALAVIGERLTNGGSIQNAQDIYWLEWAEIRKDLEESSDRRALVLERKAETERLLRSDAPEQIGPDLPSDAPRMYLVREVLSLSGKYKSDAQAPSRNLVNSSANPRGVA